MEFNTAASNWLINSINMLNLIVAYGNATSEFLGN
jgi:hypothetical protein